MDLNPNDLRSLTAVLDELIPPSSKWKMPGAGELGLAEQLLAEAQNRPDLVGVIEQGLRALDDRARALGAASFGELEGKERAEVMRSHGEADAAFARVLLFPVAIAYYQHPAVLVAMGREARPPFPKGYDVQPTDFSILDPVRSRGPLYRKA